VRTTDGGATWTLQQTGTTAELLGLRFSDARHGSAVGVGGTMLRYYSDLSLVSVPASSVAFGPAHLCVSPNPLASGARVTYSVAARGEVSLCVYDLAGRLISTLARGVIPAGVDEAGWSMKADAGQRVRPGIYFVELRAGAQRMTTRVAVLQ
jgi:hypothetical protein